MLHKIVHFLNGGLFYLVLVSVPAIGNLNVEAQAPANAGPSRVLLISVDGMHALDLARYVAQNPNSTFARLLTNGVNYTAASSAKPADSFPGMLAIATGGSPASTGVYFDVSYDRSLYPPGVTNGPPGTPVIFNETVDLDPNAADGGGGLNVNRLPLDPSRGFAPVYPHDYVRVNTIFEVAKAAGLRTAWCDKHLTDEIVNGPSGRGVDDLYIPEINAANNFGISTTKSLELTEIYDDGKVQAIINQIDGLDHTGANTVGVPAIFGLNFQAVSVAQRLNKNKTPTGSNVKGALAGPGGYLDGAGTPTALVAHALANTDASLGRILTELENKGLLASTYIILTAKHGQAPIDPTKLRFVDPALVTGLIDPSVVHVVAQSGDDAVLLWLQDQSRTADAVSVLLRNQTNISTVEILANESLKLRFPDPKIDPRVPDIIAIGNAGTIYSTSTGKVAEHGGFSDQDVNVPIVISNPGLAAQTIKTPVQTAQVAPTILQLLGLNPFALQAVQMEHTTVLPGFDAVFATIDGRIVNHLDLNTNSIIELRNGQSEFTVSGVRTQSFTVQASSDLTNWTSILTNSFVAGGSKTIKDTQAPGLTNRFYRTIQAF
jgi:hypothetical protein